MPKTEDLPKHNTEPPAQMKAPGFKNTLSYIRRSRSEKELQKKPITTVSVDLDASPVTSDHEVDSKKEFTLEDSETLSEEESSDIIHDDLMERKSQASFFDALGSIPSITDIKMSSEEDNLTAWSSKFGSEFDLVKTDQGRFVDPLTGEIMSSSSTEVIGHAEVIEESVEEENEDDDYSDIDDDLLVEPDIAEDLELKQESMDDMELWNELQHVDVVEIEDNIDFEALQREEEHRKILESTERFLGELIDHIVGQCEYVDPKVILRKHLNKKELINKLEDLLVQLDVEQKGHTFLHRKVVEHFRRKKSFRPITEDNPETISENIEKYRVTRNKLEQLLGREHEIKTIVGDKSFLMLREIESMELNFLKQQKSLEDTIKKSLNREDHDRLRTTIANQLRSMSELRNEVTKVRYSLIQHQHSMATIIEQSEKLENLGEGLKLTDFLALSNQTQALEKKSEERTNDLLRLRRRFSVHLHARAHLREKLSCYSTSVGIRESVLEDLMEEHQICRKNLLDLKLKRAQLLKKNREQSFQGGLSDKPLLMFDYDQTVERVEKLRKRVNHLRQKHTEMQNRVDLMENQTKCNLK